MDHPAPGGSGGLPYEVGCPAFTRELRQFQWPSHRTFKPDVVEKYNRKTHPSEFHSIYTIAMQSAGSRDDKVLANYFPLALKPNVMSWLMHLPLDSIFLGQIGATSSLVPSLEVTKLMAQIRPRTKRIRWQVHQPRQDIGFKC